MATTIRLYYGFPWGIENKKAVPLPYPDYVKHQISERLMQPLGQRVMNREVGSLLEKLRNISTNEVLYSFVRVYINYALKDLPIIIQSITIQNEGNGIVNANIRYLLDDQSENFIFNISTIINGN